MAWRMEPPTGDPQRELKLTCMNNLLATSEARLYFKDLLGQYILLSSGWVAAYAPGRTAEELIGKTDFDVFSDAHANAALTDEQEIIRTGQPMIGKLGQETFKGRANAWVSTTRLPLRDGRGKIIGTFGFSRDVTAYIAGGQPVGQP